MNDNSEPAFKVRVIHIEPFRKPGPPPGIIGVILMAASVVISVTANLPVHAMIAATGFCIIATVRACARYIVESIRHG